MARAVAAVEALEPRRLLSASGLTAPIYSRISDGAGAPFAIAVADVNGDGIPDLIVANDNGTISVLPGNKDGSFGTPSTFTDGLPDGPGSPQDLVVGGQGSQIIVTNTAAHGTVSVLGGDGDGQFGLQQQLQCARNGATVNALTVSYEISIEVLATANSDGSASLTPCLFQFVSPGIYSIGTSSLNEVVAGDFFQPDVNDFAFQSANGSVSELVFDLTRGFDPPEVVTLAGQRAVAIAAADVNGDGLADLLVANNDGSVATLLGGSTGFTLGGELSVEPGPVSSARLWPWNVSGDGEEDLLYTQYVPGASQSTILVGDGTGGFSVSTAISAGAPIVLADLTGDGKTDLISAYYSSASGYSSVGVQLNQPAVAPVFRSAPAATFAAGYSGTFTVEALGYPAATLTESGALPAGLTFTDNGNDTGTLSGTPAADAGGIYTLTFSAANGNGSPATQSFVLTVGPPQAPHLASLQSQICQVGTPHSFTIAAANFPTASLSYTGTLPPGLNFNDNGNGTATVAGTPAAGSGGVYDLTIAAANVAGSATEPLTITVNQPAAIVSAAQATFIATEQGSFTVQTTGYPTASLAVSGDLPPGLNFTDNGNGTATLAGIPTQPGTYTLNIGAGNGVSSQMAAQTFTLTVAPAPCLSSADQAVFHPGVAGTFAVTAANVIGAGTLLEVGALPGGVTFTDNGNGTATLAGVPAASGIYRLRLLLLDAGYAFAQNFTLIVTAPPAITSGDAATFNVGQKNSFTIAASGVPAPALTVSGALPGGVTFTDNGNGTATLSGTGIIGGCGVYPLTITADNGIGTPAIQSFTLQVDQKPVFTVGDQATFRSGQFDTFTVVTNGYPTAELLESGALPSGVGFTDNGDGTATISGIAAGGTAGTYTLTLTAINGAVSKQTFTLTVLPGVNPAITSASQAYFTVGRPSSFVVTTTGLPAASISAAGPLPPGLTWVTHGDGTAILSGTPLEQGSGVYNLSVTASNGVGSPAVQTLVVTINGPPSIAGASGTLLVGRFGSVAISTTGFPTPALREIGKLPPGVRFHDNGNGTATISGVPGGKPAIYPLIIIATNALGQSTASVYNLLVNQVPSFTSVNHSTFTVGVAMSFLVHATGYPAATIGTTSALPAGLILTDNGNGTVTISGTPSAGSAAKYTLILSASNGVGSAVLQTFTLTVVNPVARIQTISGGAPLQGNPPAVWKATRRDR
jgi:hypothetical protein